MGSNGVEIRRLTASDDLVAAYRFIYREYVKSGYIEPNPLCLRIRDGFELGWCMTTFAAFDGDEIIGTMSLIEDGDFGIPMDQHHPVVVNDARRYGDVCEISNMAISPDTTGGIRILRGLILSIWQTCVDRSVRHLFISVSPKHVDHFANSFGFIPIGPPQPSPPRDIVQGMMLDTKSERAANRIGPMIASWGPTPDP
jgi:hypothetical protein